MLKWLKDLLTLRKRFNELQKAHDLRAVLNTRLHAENDRLRKLQYPGKKVRGAKKQAEQATAALADHKALTHIASQRQNIIVDLLRDYVTDEQFVTICREINQMTDQQVLAYKKPKRAA